MNRFVLVDFPDPVDDFGRIAFYRVDSEHLHVDQGEALLGRVHTIFLRAAFVAELLMLVLVRMLQLWIRVRAGATEGDVLVFVEVELLFSSFVHEEDQAGFFVRDDDAFFEVVEELLVACPQYLRLDEEQADDVDDDVHGGKVEELVREATYALENHRRRHVLLVDEASHGDLEYLEREDSRAGRPKVEVKQAEVEDGLAD